MTGRTHLIIPDPHSHPDYSNERFDWIGRLIKDVKPDVVVNLGDHWDFNSLSSYEVGRKAFNGRNYGKDIDAGHDAHERMFGPIKKSKRKQPYRVWLEGNHERRLAKAINLQPELEGERFGISYGDLDLRKWYNDRVFYNGTTPGIYCIDGVFYSHYFVSGVMGRAIGGENPANSLLGKQFASCTAGHLHCLDFSRRTNVAGVPILGLLAGCYQDYHADWAGEANKLWWSGVVIKHNVENGNYDPQFVSIEALRKEYSNA